MPAPKIDYLAQNPAQYQYPEQVPSAQYPAQIQQGQYPSQAPVQYPAQIQQGQYPAQGQAPGQNPYPGQYQYAPQGAAPQFPVQNNLASPQYSPNQYAPNQLAPSMSNQQQVPSLINLNTGRFAKLEFDIAGGQFQETSVDAMHVLASELDMSRGQLGAMDLLISGGHLQGFTFDKLRIASTRRLAFSSEALLNRRLFEFTEPVAANVVAVVSQKSLNEFIASPNTLQMLSTGASNHLGNLLTEIVGSALTVKFLSAALQLQADNRIQTDVNVLIDVMKVGTAMPLSLSTKLSLQNGWLNLSDTQIMASGQELPPEMANLVISRINRLSEWGRNNPDIRFTFTQLQVIPGDRFELSGTAQLNRLRFGN